MKTLVKRILTPVFILAISFAAEAKTIFISDIDDTLKIAHSQNTFGVVANGPRLDNQFLGMSEIFNAIAKNQQYEFFYVSSAPQALMGELHEKFLEKNRFPKGGLFLRTIADGVRHKIEAISKIINKKQPTHVIMLGDNGERDVFIYDTIRKMYPNLQFSVWIHYVYEVGNSNEPGSALEPDQKPFVTSMDLALDWQDLGWLSAEQVQTISNKILPLMFRQKWSEKSGRIAFPEWLQCGQHGMTRHPVSDANQMRYYELIDARCR